MTKRRALLLALIFSVPVFGATRTWTGAASTNWTNGGNWSGGVAPVAGDDLVFGDAAGTHQPLNDFPAGTQFHSLKFNPTGGLGNDAGAGYVVSGNRILLMAGIDATSAAGSSQLAFPITLGASQTWAVQSLDVNADVDLGPNTLSASASGALLFEKPISGSGGVTVTAGTVMMTAVNTYTGVTSVTAGEIVCSSCVLAGAVNVTGGAIFDFGSTLGARVPSTGPMTVSHSNLYVDQHAIVNGNLTFDSGALRSGDTLSVNGQVTLGSALLDPPLNPASPYLVIDNDGSDAVNGTFANLPEGAQLNGYVISYHGGTGNDVVLIAQTATTISSTPNPSAAGEAVTISATVASVFNAGTPAGVVTFYDGAAAIGSKPAVAVSKGLATASLTTSSLTPGVHHLTATFTPSNSNFVGSTSPVYVHVVNPVPTTTSLFSTPNPVAVGASAVLSALVSASNGAIPTGAVTFYSGSTVVGIAPVMGPMGVATVSTGALSAGDHSFTATYASDTATFGASTAAAVVVSVQSAPSSTTTLAASPRTVNIDEPVTLTASVTSSSGTPTGVIRFYEGTTLLGTQALASGQATAIATFDTPGLHFVRATFTRTGASSPDSTSAAVTITVNPATRRRSARH